MEENKYSKSGFWQVPNGFVRKIRQMSLNEVRQKCHELAAALVDQRNANHILNLRLEALQNPKPVAESDVKMEESKV